MGELNKSFSAQRQTRKSSCGKPHEAYRKQPNLSRGVPQSWPGSTGGKDLGLESREGTENPTGVPPPGGEQTENITFPILRMRAVNITVQ